MLSLGNPAEQSLATLLYEVESIQWFNCTLCFDFLKENGSIANISIKRDDLNVCLAIWCELLLNDNSVFKSQLNLRSCKCLTILNKQKRGNAQFCKYAQVKA